MLPENNRMSTLTDLQREYRVKLRTYNYQVSRAISRDDTSALPDIRRRNEEISKLLEQMLNGAVGDPQSLRSQREELVNTLNRIESDYAGMSEATDALQRLRKMRETETGVVRQTFNWYLFLFILTCMGILFMAFFAPQNIATTAISAPMPRSTAPLV